MVELSESFGVEEILFCLNRETHCNTPQNAVLSHLLNMHTTSKDSCIRQFVKQAAEDWMCVGAAACTPADVVLMILYAWPSNVNALNIRYT